MNRVNPSDDLNNDQNFIINNNNLTSTSSKILRENSLIEPVVKNPFIHTLVLSKTDRLKLVVGGLILMPIRLLCIGILGITALFVSLIITVGVSDEELTRKPLRGWRRVLRGFIRFLGRSIGFCCGFHKIRKVGRRVARKEATLFVAAPHSSFFDAFVIIVAGLPSGVSRSENAKIPLVGRLVKCMQPILVNREDTKNKLNTIEEIKRRADPNSEWSQIIVFPEGTTTNRTCLITFKPGAFIPGLPVQPIIVQYMNKRDTITWTWQGPNAYKCLFYTLCQFNNKLRITYLPVYHPSDAEKLDAKLFANNVRNVMADFLQLSTTNHTYEDCRLMLKAGAHNLPFESAIIEFNKLKDKLNIDFENCEKLLLKYSNFARKSDGKMTLKEFCQYLDLPPSEAVVHVFNLYDRNKDGKIDFREFVIGLSLISRPANTEDTLKFSFEMFDQDGKSHISLADLQSILYSAFSMPHDEVKVLFDKIDSKKQGHITFDELKSYAAQKPEYEKIFSVYHELKILKNNVELEKLASETSMSMRSSAAAAAATNSFDKNNNPLVNSAESNTSLTKRPQSDRTRDERSIFGEQNIPHIDSFESNKEDATVKRNEIKND